MNCSTCKKQYEPFNTTRNKLSKLCITCREKQIAAEAKRPVRIRNYQAEAKRNLEGAWKTFLSKSVERREKECTLTKEQYLDLIQKHCAYCDYYNKDEINGIDRLDNTKGYIVENCVSCCKHCNRMKHIFHPVFFIEKAKLITKHNNNKLSDNDRKEFYKKWKEYIHKVPVPYNYLKRTTQDKRDIEFSLTDEEYNSLIYKPCYLCGFKNSVGNGLDRQDTNKGYCLSNVEVCCSSCNMMKAFYNKDDFIKHMKQISDFKVEYPLEWNSIVCTGFQMGGAKSDVPKKEKVKQWRSVSIYKAVKADSYDEFKEKTLKDTHWDEDTFNKYLNKELIDKIINNKYEMVEDELKKLVETIRYARLGRC